MFDFQKKIYGKMQGKKIEKKQKESKENKNKLNPAYYFYFFSSNSFYLFELININIKYF